MTISKDILEILACPQCKGALHFNQANDGLVCDKCRLLYEINDEIPNFIISEAKELNSQTAK